ncbi:nucleotidyltransferase domain-containing protein [Photobacterium makurazakiensis]|uniref:nucleotidyltransferase domain-containing protein n=1 Tax=Photobacterium makurazakiensis TaxID=2910234 RepID=UPI003D09CDE2
MPTALPTLDSQSPLQTQCHSIVVEAVTQLSSSFGTALHSIYLSGSVARRTATIGDSDLNLTLVLNRALSPAQDALLSTIKYHFANQQKVFTQLSLRVVLLEDVLSISSVFTWGVWLKHSSFCLYGDDLSSRFGCFEPSWDIAKSLNGDIAEQLKGYRQKIMTTKVLASYIGYCQAIAKKMIWSCFSLVLHREKKLALSLDDAAKTFLKYYPEKETEIERLYILCSGQQVPKKAALFMINEFGGWIVTEFDKIERKIG